MFFLRGQTRSALAETLAARDRAGAFLHKVTNIVEVDPPAHGLIIFLEVSELDEDCGSLHLRVRMGG